MSSGPVGMSNTPIGTVFLYEMEPGDLSEYERQPYDDPRERVRWLLSRVASKSSAGNGRERPAMLGRAEVAALGDDDIEGIADVFLASPSHEWHARKSLESGELPARAADEPASQYLDRLVRWRSSLPPEAVARRPVDVFSPASVPSSRTAEATPQVLTWVSAGLAIAVLLSAASLAFAALSYFEGKADHQANELWRGEMKRLQEAKPAAGSEKLVAELAAENARLRYRLELREGGKASPPPAKAPVTASKPATRSPPKYSSNRSGRQAPR